MWTPNEIQRLTGQAIEKMFEREEIVRSKDFLDLDTHKALEDTGSPFLEEVWGVEDGVTYECVTVWFPCGCRVALWDGKYSDYLSNTCDDHQMGGE